MCLAVPGRVVKIEDKTAIVDVMGASAEVSVELIRNVDIGDYVLVHAGCAIQRIDEDEALDTIKLFKELKELVNEK
ncbi:hydrogenase maturation protein HypC [Anaerobacterium chartisolvens]|uniref:Hydrogenase maturation protein HypC n=1 Tax=Anaerobacterium chartisolvens TaxID=1297424 RepID=A0A369AT13_9FIRM|nr:HypC/HybG/HupF family hydrogenase formation chaperone [Anaerobacterium chartisolvens]RCX12225.1 hydrogenase maturation protein HypC [Anaerobacterium chartisolvens]